MIDLPRLRRYEQSELAKMIGDNEELRAVADEMVHDVASQLATRVNNAGPEAQLTFLRDNLAYSSVVDIMASHSAAVATLRDEIDRKAEGLIDRENATTQQVEEQS
jgi:hypothetical protein